MKVSPRFLLVLSLVASGAAVLSACRQLRVTPQPVLTGEQILRLVHERYTGKRFTHVTFVQTTEHGNGATDTWYEALAPLGRVRADIAPIHRRNGFMYRADSQYVFRDGQVVERYGGQRWLSMLILLDIYAMPMGDVLARTAELGMNLQRGHAGTWRGRPVYVAGALAGDTTSPQVWYDQTYLYPVRLIQRAWTNPTLYDWEIDRHLNVAGGRIEREIRIFSGGRLLVKETYDNITPRATLPDSLFIPDPYRPPAWRHQGQPLSAPRPCRDRPPGSAPTAFAGINAPS